MTGDLFTLSTREMDTLAIITRLAERRMTQAEAVVGATIDDVWSGEGTLDARDRASLRLAATHAARAAARVVDATYHLGGGASI